jgi:SAM-dependent methyltransferase
MTTALDVYDAALRGEDVLIEYPGGATARLPVARWCELQLPGDDGLLDRCVGPVLDVGRGPGRFVAALANRRVAALGVDISSGRGRRARGRRGSGVTALWAVDGGGAWFAVLSR